MRHSAPILNITTDTNNSAPISSSYSTPNLTTRQDPVVQETATEQTVTISPVVQETTSTNDAQQSDSASETDESVEELQKIK